MAIVSIYISIIILNIKKLNSIETHKIAEWTKKKKEITAVQKYVSPQENYFSLKDTQRLTVMEWKKILKQMVTRRQH